MHFISKQKLKILNCPLEVFNIHGKIFEEYPSVISGYLFHFTFGQSLNPSDDLNLSIEFHWKHEIVGTLEELRVKLEDFKDALLSIDEELYQEIDQFAYINLFIVPKDDTYQLVISSDTFDIGKLIILK